MEQNILFKPFHLNQTLTLSNRIVMAPMTRNFADENFVPTQLMADYYARRADVGLIVTEGTIIRYDGRGYPNPPGIYTQAQIKGWQQVTRAVHEKNGLIFNQIWHVGRVTHPYYIGGKKPISASATTLSGNIPRSKDLVYGDARAVTLSEIKNLIESYAIAAKNARLAGFDGIEIHGANGYLIDQFLHYHTNHRTDDYGGTPENMARFVLSIVKACGELIGFDRVGLRLSPGGYLNGIVTDENDAKVYAFLLKELNKLKIAYVHTGNFNDDKIFPELKSKTMTEFMRSYYEGTLIACGGYTLETANKGIINNQFDLVAFGKSLIANPDLIHLAKNNLPLRAYDVNLLHTLY